MITFLASQWHIFSTFIHLSNKNDITLSLDENKETKSLCYKDVHLFIGFTIKLEENRKLNRPDT